MEHASAELPAGKAMMEWVWDFDLLRTIAVNLILGMTGTKVCATRFRFKPVMIFSSMRTTNSKDKSTGSKMFLGKLAEKNGTGIIATHDISLSEMEKTYPQKIFNKCFEIEIRGGSVIFDYKLRDGITKHMNVGILMRQMGIV